MDGDAFEKDWLTIEQYLFAAGFDGAESNLVANGRVVDGNRYLIEFWILRTPELEFV